MKIRIKINYKTIFNIALIIALFFIGFFTNEYLYSEKKLSENIDNNKKYINKSIILNLGKHYIINFKPLRLELEKIREKYEQKTYIYFLYLNNGSWIGLNEREKFAAASLVKVPLALAAYKAKEENKIDTNKEYTIEEIDLDSGFGDLYKTGNNRTFTIEALIRIMLQSSDNTAKNAIMNVLVKHGIKEPLSPIYQHFGWTLDFGQKLNASEIDLKTLSNMFLALYDADYINIDNSNSILEYLAQTPFNNKIVAGIPRNIPVSHKIGISDGNKTFSDCGIVYVPDRIYLLCLGSNGLDEEMTDKFMKEVSEATYRYVMKN